MTIVKRPGDLPGASGRTVPEKVEPSAVGVGGQIGEIGRKLSMGTDALRAKLSKFERVLCELNLGVSASVDTSDGDDFENDAYTELSFMKRGSKWGLFVVKGTRVSSTQRVVDQETPLLTATKKQRVAAAGVINDLLAALLDAAQQQLEAVEQANRSLDEALAGPLRDVAIINDPFADAPVEFSDEIPF